MKIQIIESDSTVISLPDKTTEITPHKGYEATRFNAMKHGILSKEVVLAHEDQEEFSNLLNNLIDEYQPAGITEIHLIEELAGIIWRKRRVLLAENANINRNLHSVIHNKLRSPIQAAAPFEYSLWHKDSDLIDLLKTKPEDMPKYLQNAKLDLESVRKTESILRKGGINSYNKALRALTSGNLSLWELYVDKDAYPATAEGLDKFIQQILAPICIRTEYEMQFTSAIKKQTLGEGFQAERLENLTRYEIHLDRKFERTLAMLLKVKERRCSK